MSLDGLNELKKKFNKELDNFFVEKIKKASKIDSSSVEMIELLRDYTLRGGKRVRAAMLYYGYRCFSDKNLDRIVKVSICIELVQSYLLIHDDIIDKSDLRRGKLSLHKSYEKIAKKYYKNTDIKHFGTSMAICAGDIISAFANEILAKSNFKDKYKVLAINKMNNIIHKVIHGQVLDILSELRDVSVKEVSLIHKLKTATYTIQGPLHIGAILAGAKKKHLEILSKYAMPLGQAFQIQDDIIGMFGDCKKVGKPIDSDLKEGKKTLLILKALEKASVTEKKIINSALGNSNLTKKQFSDVQKIIKKTDSLEYSKDLAKELISKSKKAILKSKFKNYGKQNLIEIANYLEKREF
jgi:geranylgeranyl diphosphate synthase, type I